MEAFYVAATRREPTEREAGLAAATDLDRLLAALPEQDRSRAAVGVGAQLSGILPAQPAAPTPPNVGAALERLLASRYGAEVAHGLGTSTG